MERLLGPRVLISVLYFVLYTKIPALQLSWTVQSSRAVDVHVAMVVLPHAPVDYKKHSDFSSTYRVIIHYLFSHRNKKSLLGHPLPKAVLLLLTLCKMFPINPAASHQFWMLVRPR